MARLLAVVAVLAALAWTVSAALAPQASLQHQLQEKSTLLAIARHFNHPVFANIGWVAQAPNMTYDESLPCGKVMGQSTWDFVVCANGYVYSIQLDGNVYSDPLPTNDIYGNPTLERGYLTWAQGATPGPIAGTIPWDLLLQLPLLNYVSMSSNALYGPALPDNIDQLPFLQVIQLSFNSLSGTIPASVAKLSGVAPGPHDMPSGLLELNLGNNQITGPIPAGLGSLTTLTTLNLLVNNMTGNLPPDLGTSTTLTKLSLGNNMFTGVLPDAWGSMSQLQYLFVLDNLLTGTVPQSYANMKALDNVDISHNLFSGPFPNFTGSLTNLTTLMMSSNGFYGPVPVNFWAPPNLTNVDISANYMNGNIPLPPTHPKSTLFAFKYQSNCFANGDSSANSPFLGMLTLPQRNTTDCGQFYQVPASSTPATSFPIVAIIVPVIFVILLAFATISIIFWRRQKIDSLDHLFGKNLKQTVTAFSLKNLKTATKNFDTSIGKGGYGTVYKGILKDGTIVAVKRLDQVSKQGDAEFIQEVELLSRLHHRHLVNLVGFCAEKGERVLVYEYMAMGSLYEHIHGPNVKNFPLSWDSRTKIAIHIALGLEYLHYGADPPLIHRDIKSANILISEDGYSKVADFGLCKEAPLGGGGSDSMVPTTTAVKGSFGYLDPEYVNTSILSEKSDVYSYGVVLLELISGHKSIHQWQPLAYWAEEYLADREKTPLMVDPLLEGSFDIDELYALCDIARTCVQDAAVLRPTIRDVAKALVENLGHAFSSSGGSVQDSASSMGSSLSELSSIPSFTTPSQQEDALEYSYQNYSGTLHWTPPDSGKIDTTNLTTPSAGIGRLPVPMPPKRGGPPPDSSV